MGITTRTAAISRRWLRRFTLVVRHDHAGEDAAFANRKPSPVPVRSLTTRLDKGHRLVRRIADSLSLAQAAQNLCSFEIAVRVKRVAPAPPCSSRPGRLRALTRRRWVLG